MNLRKRFRITTWIISLIAFIGWIVGGVVDGGYHLGEYLFAAFASFATIWLIYWIFYWIVKWFGKEKVLKVIKWAVIIFFASILFHLADYVVHETIEIVFKVKPHM